MKRFTALFLAVIMCLSLCGCTQTKNQMLKNAQELLTDNLDFTLYHDLDLAIEDFDEKPFTHTGTVSKIEITKQGQRKIVLDDGIDKQKTWTRQLGDYTVFFSEKEDRFDQLKIGDTITIVGIMHVTEHENGLASVYIGNAYLCN